MKYSYESVIITVWTFDPVQQFNISEIRAQYCWSDIISLKHFGECFRLLVMSGLDFKANADSLLAHMCVMDYSDLPLVQYLTPCQPALHSQPRDPLTFSSIDGTQTQAKVCGTVCSLTIWVTLSSSFSSKDILVILVFHCSIFNPIYKQRERFF